MFSFIPFNFRDLFIQVITYPDPVLGLLGARWESTLDGTVTSSTTHIFEKIPRHLWFEGFLHKATNTHISQGTDFPAFHIMDNNTSHCFYTQSSHQASP